MVRIAIVLDESGCLAGMTLEGHAAGGKGGPRSGLNLNPACMAVSLMARTVARTVAARTGWTVDGDAPEPGNLYLVIKRRPEDTDEWLGGVTDTLLQALADIEAEYPESIAVSIEEKYHGS